MRLGIGVYRQRIGRRVYIYYYRYEGGRQRKECMGREDRGGMERARRALRADLMRLDTQIHRRIRELERNLARPS